MNNNKTILLVEDDVIVAMAEAHMLEDHGFRVITAHDGGEAVDAARKNPAIDLILMDVELGTGMDGVETAEGILKERDFPVLFLSSHSEPEIVEKIEKTASYGYVLKNSGETVLLASIGMAFRLHEAHIREKELAEKLHLQSLVLDQIQDRVIVTDLEGVITYVNDSGCASLQKSKEELLGNTVYSFGDDPRQGATQREIVDTTISRGHWRGEVVNFSSNGSEVVFDSRTQLVVDRSGRPVAMCGISTDITGRKRLEKELHAREEMYRHLVDNANSIILCMDPKGVVLYFNKFAQRFFGFTPEEIIGRNVVGTIVPERDTAGRDLELMVLDIGVNPGKYSSNENENVRKDGSRVWISWTNRAILNERGEVTEILCIGNDTTERKRIEDALRESERKFRLLAETSTDVIWIMSFQGRFLYVSPSVKALSGFTPEEVLEIPFERYVLPEHVVPVMETITNELALPPGDRKKSHTMELRQYHKDGRVIDIEVTASYMYDENGEVAAIQGSTRDITARKEMERRLKEQTEFLSDLIDAMPNPVFYKDVEGRYLGCNRAFEEFLGLGRETIIGKSVFEISPPDLAKRYHEADRALFESQGTQVYESSVESEGGTRRNVVFHKATFPGPGGEVAGIIGAILDITERKQAEEKLLTVIQESDILREKAERLNEEKELLLREVHHRIKNNMSTIMSLLSLQAQAMKDAVAVEAITEAKNRVQSMLMLYDKLYRSEDYRSISIREYLPRLVEEITGLYAGIGSVKTVVDVDDQVVSAKKLIPLGIIVNELLTNAMKYAFAGRTGGTVRVTARSKDGVMTVIIQDDGVGVPPDVGMERSRGFGFQLVGLLVKQLSGTIRLERDGGTRFVVDFRI